MKSNKSLYFLIIFIALFFNARMVSAYEIGLGATLVSGEEGAGIIVPIRLDLLTIEPEVTLTNVRTDSENNLNGQEGDSNRRQIQVLSGVYLRKDFGKALEGYYGGRVGIGQFQNNDNFQDGGSRDETSNSLILIPTFGLQYYFNKQFSMGIDAGLRIQYSKREFELTDGTGTVTNDGEETSTWTQVESRVVVRALF